MIELVVVIVILAILAAEVWPRFARRRGFDTRGFADQARAGIQYARKLALASGRNVCVAASGDTLSLAEANGRGRGAACVSAVTNPATGDAYSITSPVSDVFFSNSLALTFHANGAPSSGGSLTVRGEPDITITIDGTTGYVR